MRESSLLSMKTPRFFLLCILNQSSRWFGSADRLLNGSTRFHEGSTRKAVIESGGDRTVDRCGFGDDRVGW